MRRHLPRTAGFVVAYVSFVLIFVSAGSPIPLYNVYRAENGLTNADLAVATAVYLIAAAVSLLVLGRLSDHLGRRAVGAGALLSSALGPTVLLGVDGPPRPGWLPAAVTSAAPMLSIPLGALLSGALVDHAPAPRHLVYAVLLGLLLLAAVLVAVNPETTTRTTARRALGSLRPRVHVPAGAGRAMAAMAGLILATWSLGGFYQAFGPSIAQEQLGSHAALTAGAVFGSFTVLSLLGGPLTGRLRPDVALRTGAVAYALCVAGILLTLGAAAIVPFLAVSLVAGVTQGVAQTGGMRTLLSRTAPADRAGLLSTVFLVNYGCAAVPSLIAGRLTGTFSMLQIAGGYAVLVVIGVAAVLLLARMPAGATVADRSRTAVLTTAVD